jgi:hypothetical protein
MTIRRLSAALLLALAQPAAAQVQVRFGDPARANYSELHEALKAGTPEADTVAAIMGATSTRVLWPRVRAALAGEREWNDGLMALTRIAELRDPKSADSVARWRGLISKGALKTPLGVDPQDLLPALHAVALELARSKQGDAAILRDLLLRVPGGQYDLGDAWVFGRLGAGASDSAQARFLAAGDPQLKFRYLTLLSFSRDSALIPLLERVYTAPDSFGIRPRMAIRASDGLLWIGTRRALQALFEARTLARARGIYDDPALRHAEMSFLENDSSAVISRTGKWLTEWLDALTR